MQKTSHDGIRRWDPIQKRKTYDQYMSFSPG